MSAEQQLAALLQEHAHTPFVWGAHDCAQFATKSFTRLHGVPVPLPAYNNERSAARVLAAHGGAAAIFKSCGLVRKPKAAALTGDIALVKHHGAGLFDHACALVVGLVAYYPAADGLQAVTRSDWLEVWGAA